MTTTSSFMSTFPTRASGVASLLRVTVVLMAVSWVVSGLHAYERGAVALLHTRLR